MPVGKARSAFWLRGVLLLLVVVVGASSHDDDAQKERRKCGTDNSDHIRIHYCPPPVGGGDTRHRWLVRPSGVESITFPSA